MTATRLLIKPMETIDLSDVVALEQESGLSSWGEAGYECELLHPQAVLLTAHYAEVFAGFFAGRVMGDEFELFSLAVAARFRRQGIGRMLLDVGLEWLKQRGIHRCYLEVRGANLPAQKLYLGYGFKTIGVRRNYYHNPPDYAVTMVWEAMVPSRGRE